MGTALLLSVAACGNSDDDGPASDTSAGASTTGGGEKVTGEPIKIGSIVDATGFTASTLGAIPDAMKAWESWVNDNGGINGHPVSVKVIDVGGDPAKAQAAAKKLVEEDKVVAIVGQVSNQAATFQKYVDAKGVPVVGGEPNSTPMFTDPNWFPTGSDIGSLAYGMADEMKQAKKTKLATMYCAEAPVCAGFGGLMDGMLKLVGGGSNVLSTKISATAPNYTAPCLAAKEAGADAMFIGQASGVISRVLDSCAQQGVKMFQIAAGGGSNEAKNANAVGMVRTQNNLPIFDTTTPGGKQLHDVVDQYAPGLTSKPSWGQAVTAAWAGLELFRKIGNDGKLTSTSTPADVKSALWKVKDETLGGLAPPLTYVEGKPTVIPCWFVERIEAVDEWTLPRGPKARCVPVEDQAAVAKVAGG